MSSAGRARFSGTIASEAELRRVLGHPAARALAKQRARLDEHCAAIIGRSPFVIVASSDRAGRVDASPRGDPPGFVKVLDERTLAIPDRPGNRRADTFRNVLQNPALGLLFLVPGRAETLRVNGRAAIVRDAALRERLEHAGKRPELVLVVDVEEVFVHCGRCMLRSQLWQPGAWPLTSDLPSHARCLTDHARLPESVATVEASVKNSYENELY